MTQEKGISSHMLAAYSYDPVALLKEDNPKFVGATRRSVLLQILTHIIALGMTAAVIQLSLRQCYFGDVDDTKFGVMSTNEALNAMQFAAKLHELFMVASLTAIVFHFSRSLLLGSRGLPLGLVTAPFRISAPDYLISSEFWGSFSRPRLILMLGLFLTTLLITTLSPVSAIMLVPSLDWWHIAEPYSEDRTGKGIPIIVRASRKDIWPMTVVPKYVSDCYQLANASNICPGQGLDDIKAWVSAYESSGLQPNITMTEISSGARRRLQSYADGEVDIPEVWDITDIPVFADNHDQFTRKQNETLEKYALSIGVEVLTTTTTHWMVAILGLVWNWAKDVNLGPINRAARPRLQIDKSIPVWDPLPKSITAADRALQPQPFW
ncbi:hypothetical protein N7510_007245 [Penicillium lagena]|uniref:uncharacterized protein n=1 Tax=Penicillium lagena TaxID=94218 RepID=UPI00254071D4|nr:uncharacterized protein N7510_007245 [Penicillium lagena]KAJ5610526.1 hypothetical protein N7510_007245 [Penicillium lagena]